MEELRIFVVNNKNYAISLQELKDEFRNAIDKKEMEEFVRKVWDSMEVYEE